MDIGVIILEHHYRGFTEEAIQSALAQTLKPKCVLLSTGDLYRVYTRFQGLRVQRLQTESEGERLLAATRECQGVDAYALLEDDDVWLPNHLERAAKYLAQGRVLYQSATQPPVFPIGANASTVAFTSDLDLAKVASYPTLIDTVLVLSAIEQGFAYVFDPSPTTVRRIHTQNISIYRKWWLRERDRLLSRLLSDFPEGPARKLAEMYVVKDYGSGEPLRRAAALVRWGLRQLVRPSS